MVVKMNVLLLTETNFVKADFDASYIHEELAELSVELFFSAGDCIRRIREILRLDVQ